MKKIKNLYFKNSIIKFMVSYAIILLLPLLISLVSYQITFHIVEEDIKENNLSMMNHSKNMIDLQIRAIDSLMLQSVNNSTILFFSELEMNNNKKFYYDSLEAIRALDDIFKYANIDIVNDVYIYLKKSDYVMRRKEIYKSKFYYETVFGKTSGYEEWKVRLSDKQHYQKYIVKEDTIEYVQMLPFSINKPVNGAVVAVLDKQQLVKFFNLNNIDEGMCLFIQDKNGQVLVNLSKDGIEPPILEDRYLKEKESLVTQTFNDKKSLISRVVSEENGWSYTLVLPEAVAMDKLIKLQGQVIGLFVIITIIGILISYYMANKNGKPVEEIKKYLNEVSLEPGISTQEINDMSEISGTISKILSRAQTLKEEIEKQKPYLEAVFFQKLIKGDFSSVQEIQFIGQRAHIELKADKYLVLNFRVFANNDIHSMDEQTLQEANILMLLIKDYIKKFIGPKVYFHDLDQLTTVVIVEKETYLHERIKEQVEKVNQQIINEYQVRPFWGISNECTNVLEIWRAFEQAKKALKMGIKSQENNVIEYSGIIEDKTRYYYPVVFEQRLIAYTKEADGSNIKKLVEILYTENFDRRELSENTIDKLYTEINSTITKLTGNTDEGQYLEDLKALAYAKDRGAVKKYFEKIIEIYLEISSSFKQVKKCQQTTLINRMIDYINEVYMDSNLGLGMIATKFNISEGYISSLFKEQTGINFTDYVEEQRINKACELLKDTNSNINEISEQVGYNSVQSFRRAFKRTRGISPSELRKGNVNV